ncbi:MAG TPA: double zinc ribbon domain-containing protein [Gemmatimonadaceae bacterium]|nr:double zinc ribbon domain-containing protein [Gemmatimonadaceae bacterium]
MLTDAVLDLVLPRACVLCAGLSHDETRKMRDNENHPRLVCDRCWRAVPLLPPPLCARCGHPRRGTECRWCASLPEHVSFARSACWVPEGTGGQMSHQLKYGGWPALADEMVRALGPLPEQWRTPGATLVVPVPLAPVRFRERGYNQSAELARSLARQWRIPDAHGAILRTRETKSQVRLTPDQRSANVHGAFGAGPAATAMRGAHVVIVDDVVTTGATLNACAAVAAAAGATTISYVTFGRARAAFDRTPHPRSETRWQFVSASTASAASVVRSSAPRKNAD